MSTIILADLGPILECLEDASFSSSGQRSKNYSEIINCLHNVHKLDGSMAERLLNICLMDFKKELQYISMNMMIISMILKKIKEGKCDNSEKLLKTFQNTALAIVMVAEKLFDKPLLHKMSIDTLLQHPDESLRVVVTEHMTEVLDLIDYSTKIAYEAEITDKMLILIGRILKILPPADKVLFVTYGIKAWFNTIIPAVMAGLTENPQLFYENIDKLEDLIEYVITIDYSTDTNWEAIVMKICSDTGYAVTLKHLLKAQNSSWHRMWIIFVKLLKDQLTKAVTLPQERRNRQTPINALLPVVETAFRMDTACRCRAFECWNVVIENFSDELNENLIKKRLALLTIPLKLHNAKVPEVILAKFNTWWHLTRRFETKMEKCSDTVLIPFMNFCYDGVCLTTEQVAKKSVEALVEIVGHTDCEGCVTLPRLNTKLINTKLLVSHWQNWVKALTIAVKNTSNNDSEMKRLTCIWKGFVLTIAELPENQIRADLVVELLKLVESLKNEGVVGDIIFDILIRSVIENDKKVKQLLKTKGGDGPMHVVIRILNSHDMNYYYDGIKPEELIVRVKPIMRLFMDPAYTDPDDIVMLWMEGFFEMKLVLWAALAEAIYESGHKLMPDTLHKFIRWPLSHANPESARVSECPAVWYKWFTLYNFAHATKPAKFDKSIMSLLRPGSNFSFLASIAMLKHQLLSPPEEGCQSIEFQIESLLKALQSFEDFKSVEKYFPILIDTFVLLLESAYKHTNNSKIMQTAVTSMTLFFKLVNGALAMKETVINVTLLEHLMKPIGSIFKSEKCLAKVLITPLVDELCSCALNVSENASLKYEITRILTLTLSIYHKGTYMFNKVTDTIATVKRDLVKETSNSGVSLGNTNINSTNTNTINQNGSETPLKQLKQNSGFTTPRPRSAKKNKKKELTIVNTVEENGETFEVVDSHWKFNPRNLTENQKEKLKRKREDIPALYQDLSQSQDEFKLKAWNTDSQDASNTTSSKSESDSKTNEEATETLKNISSTEVVPIIENAVDEIANKDVDKPAEKPVGKRGPKTPASKDPKSPRLALQDRVFRNVRSLMEKSGTQSVIKDSAIVLSDLNQTGSENNLKTPLNKANSITTVPDSAPSNFTLERPSRSIKKPRKFDDAQMFGLKKRRRSQGSLVLDSFSENEPTEIETATKMNELRNDESASKPADNSVKANIEPELPQKDSNITGSLFETASPNNEEPILQSQENVDHPAEMDVELKIQNTLVDQNSNKQNNDDSQIIEDNPTPKPADKHTEKEKSTNKNKLTRTEKQLLIDMVEGNPLLQQEVQSTNKHKLKRAEKLLLIDMVEGNPLLQQESQSPGKRTRRGRHGLIEKSSEDKSGMLEKKKVKTYLSASKIKNNDASLSQTDSPSITIVESQDTLPESSSISEDIPISEDVIESSQDSSITIKSTSSKKKIPLVSLVKINVSGTQKVHEKSNNEIITLSDSFNDSKDDIELPKNKTAVSEEKDLTQEMDTEPLGSSEVILVNNEVHTPIVINTEDTSVGKETQDIAEAETLPMEGESQIVPNDNEQASFTVKQSQIDNNITNIPTQDTSTPTLFGTAEAINDIIQESSNTGSPSRDNNERKKEFLNDTIEISPIKILSPISENKPLSPETSSGYDVIKLSTPVLSNGEPYEKCDSPEVFTEDKVSPDKRDQSPPRKVVSNNNSSSPNSSLSLKKNRMRFNTRAAQMLKLAVPNSATPENEEPVKSSSPVSTPAKRNLKKVMSTENNESSESDGNENFLKFTRALPTSDCSPSGPILKRKLAEITDEATVSPACKRKRVSFHDPPVSTTVAVQKYIDPNGIRSPSNSNIKRLERQTRAVTNGKSPKRLETVLTKTVESFSDETTNSNNIESSLDETPAVEIIKTNELNDKDPICGELLDCKDPIENIAGELSSPSTKELLIKELKGKVDTIADLAKLSELEVNRLCIKAPKVKVAKKVLMDYATKRAKIQEISNAEDPITVDRVSMEVQTNIIDSKSCEMQTEKMATSLAHTQTDGKAISHCSAQTIESGSRSTEDIVASCLAERSDFVHQLAMQLDQSSLRKIAEKLDESSRREIAEKLSESSLLVLAEKLSESSLLVLSEKLGESSVCKIAEKLSMDAIQSVFMNKMTATNMDCKDIMRFFIEVMQKACYK